MMGEFSAWHLLIVALVFLALFGYKKLPDAARSIGRSMRVFTAEMHQMRGEDVAAAPRDRPEPTASTGPVLPSAHHTHPHTVPPRSEPVTGGDG